LNQRLGQCYAALGRKSEALNAYTKAVSAYEAAISQHGQTAALKSGLESCKAAMKVLRS
jgi:predicted negative regulator of RcsB-dependent stress response